MAERVVWIKVPVKAVERAIELLKGDVMDTHEVARKLRDRADRDEAYAEALKKALREEEEPPAGRK